MPAPMSDADREKQLEQIRRDADEDFENNPCPEPTVEQMRRVGQVFRAARQDQRQRTASEL